MGTKEDFWNTLCLTIIRDSPDSNPEPTVTVPVIHDCTNEISVLVFIYISHY